MAPNKFEKHIRERLKEREITPSANAWDKISEQLEVSEKPRSKRLYWYGVAAGFIGLVLISGWFFDTNKVPRATQTVKEEIQGKPILKQPETEVVSGEKINTRVFESKVLTPDKPIKVTTAPSIVKLKNTAIAFVDRSDKVVEKVKIPFETSNELIDTKVAEIVAQVEFLEKENSVVTEAEIDMLLLRAQEEIIENKIIGANNSVDPMALLADVEDELDESFRDQIFDALKDGFIKVRTAVADRNK